MAITNLWHSTRSRRHTQRSNKLCERLGPQLFAPRRHRLSMLARSPSQSQRASLSMSVTHYVQLRLILKSWKEENNWETPKVEEIQTSDFKSNHFPSSNENKQAEWEARKLTKLCWKSAANERKKKWKKNNQKWGRRRESSSKVWIQEVL